MPPRPESFPRVADDFAGPVLIEVAPDERIPKSDRYWHEDGMVDNPLDAKVYPNAATAMVDILEEGCPEGSAYPVDALAVLADEEARVAEFRRRVEGVTK
jgi:hypothetical protein